MIDSIINRIKDAYWDLERDGARRERFFAQTQGFTPGMVQPPPSAMPQMPGAAMPQPGMGMPPAQPGAAPAPVAPPPEPSLLDVIGSRR